MGQKPTINMGTPVVVIVGGGAAGRDCANALDDFCNVVLIDRTPFFFFNVGALRACVEPDFFEKIIIPYDRLLTNGNFMQGEVVKITDKEIFLDGVDASIAYDYLIVATGSAYAFPFKVQRSNRKTLEETYASLQNEIKEASQILIIGGGPVGIELAGEILDIHPGKDITLLHSKKMLLNEKLPEKLRVTLASELTAVGCKLVLGERAKMEDIMDVLNGSKYYLKGKRTVETDSGKRFHTDLVFFATGAGINSASYANSMENSVSKRKELIVNDRGQVLKEGEIFYENIFAVGDCSNWGEKLQYYASKQALVVAKNIRSHIRKEPMTSTWTNPVPSWASMIVPVGRHRGAGCLSGFVVGRRVTRKLKGKELFVSDQWKALGYNTVGGKGDPIKGDPVRIAELLKVTTEQGRRLAEGLEVKDDDEKIRT